MHFAVETPQIFQLYSSSFQLAFDLTLFWQAPCIFFILLT
jgi:hypothetical protein